MIVMKVVLLGTPGNTVNCYLEGGLVTGIETHKNKWAESRTLLL